MPAADFNSLQGVLPVGRHRRTPKLFMKPEDLRAITNHFLDFHLVSLKSWKLAREFPDRDGGGPYVITQEGYDPADLTMRSGEFVLGRSGKWLPLEIMLKLPTDVRREEFIFGTASEAMQVVDRLPTTVAVWSAAPELPSADDEAVSFEAALQSGDRLQTR